jgi:hypothetical protein
MPAAAVRTFERSQVPRVGGEVGVYNAVVIPAKKGPINKPVLISNEGNLLDVFTPNGEVKIGYNIAYYSALAVLQQTHSLWVIRAANGALNGGAFINDARSNLPVSKQVNEISEEKPLITFGVTNILDGANEVDIENINGGVPSDLLNRKINIKDVGQITYTVTAVNGSTLTLDAATTASASFTGTGAGVIAESTDYIPFDADFGAGGASTTVEATGFPVGKSTADLDGRVISFVADGNKFTRTVTSVSGTTLTLDSATPSVTDQNGTGYRGNPEITSDISDITDGTTSIVVSNIAPSYISLEDFDGRTLAVSADMSDGSTLTVSSTVSNPNGANITFDDGFDNPGLINSSEGEAPYEAAQADGFEDAAGVAQPVGDLVNFDENDFYTLFTLYSVNEGEWSKNIKVEIITERLRVPGAFQINVYKNDGDVRPVESFICSRDPEAKDGYERNIFIETALQASRYIRAVNNPVMDKDAKPKETVIRDSDGNIREKFFIKFAGGDDGDVVTDSQMIFAAQLMDNKNNYPLSVFMDGGWTSPAYQSKIAQICEKRDDSFAILSVPFEAEMDPVNYITNIANYRNVELNINTSFAALYTSHVKITDKYNDRQIFVAPDGYAAAAINLSASNYEIWYPPAGYKRGRLLVDDVHVKFTDGDLDYLADIGINQIRFAPGKGIAIWGQRTLALIPSAFDRINIRLLLNTLKPAITTYLERYLFELNTKNVKAEIVAVISQYLLSLASRNGISNFSVVCDSTNNSDFDELNNTLNVDVYIQPIYSIEYINFTTILRNKSIAFSV